MEAATLVVYILPAVFAASIALIVVMLVSLAKQGDERRRAILDKACVSTFYITLGILAADAIRSAILVFIDGGNAAPFLRSRCLPSSRRHLRPRLRFSSGNTEIKRMNNQIRSLRTEKGLSQEELGKALRRHAADRQRH